MNKIIKKGLLSVALLTAVVVQASNKIVVKAAESKKVEISLSEVASAETLIIKDVQNVVLFSENISEGETLKKTFDFSTIPAGLYFIEVKEEKRVEVIPVLVSEEVATVVTNSSKKYKSPNITFDGKTAKVFVNNFNKETVKLVVVSENGTELFNKKTDELVSYNALNFESLSAGDYTLYTTIGNYSFEDTITIK